MHIVRLHSTTHSEVSRPPLLWIGNRAWIRLKSIVAAATIQIMKLAWVTYLGALSRANTILIPRISAHPPILAQCKVHHPWALFREDAALGTVSWDWIRILIWAEDIVLVSIYARIGVLVCLWIPHSTRSTCGLETFCTLPSRVGLSCSTTRNLFNHNIRAIFIFDYNKCSFNKESDFSTEVNREVTLLFPGVAHPVTVRTVEHILSKCLQKLKVLIIYLITPRVIQSCGIVHCTGMWSVLDWSLVAVVIHYVVIH